MKAVTRQSSFFNREPPPDGDLDFDYLRRRMVEDQLARRGIRDSRVLRAMAEVPREEFVAPHLRALAYEDGPLPIGGGQTISQPYTVAVMCQALALPPEARVLEIGTGSGYGAAVLSRIARHVFSLERIPELAALARARLERLGCTNVDVRCADGTAGLPEEAPFDGIIVTAAARDVPAVYFDELATDGRLVIPLGREDEVQDLCVFTRTALGLERRSLGDFVFVPLIKEGRGEEPGAHAGPAKET
jgi:protein-L-isoaspartate(D-aspartate) O-methyltransferase